MENKTKALILVLFLPALVAEILSTNMPVTAFFNPLVVFVLMLIYGCGSLLIRETKLRWKAQWSIVFLAIAYGIFEEGLATQAYFNPNWFASGALSGAWMVFGVQTGWTILLEVFHATVSTLLPLYLIERLWPELKEKQLVGSKGFALALLGTIFALSLWITLSILGGIGPREPFFAAPYLLIGGFLTIVVLAALTYYFRKSRLSFEKGLLSTKKIAFFAFFFHAMNLQWPNILAGAGFDANLGVPLQLLGVLGFVLFSASQLLNKKTETKHIVAYVFGSLIFWVVASGVVGIGGRTDLLFAAPIAFILLILWRKKALA